MKKRRFLLLTAVFLAAFFCACKSESVGENDVSEDMEGTAGVVTMEDERSIVLIPGGDWWNDDWVNPDLIYTEAVVPNEETALKIAEGVYDSLNSDFRGIERIPKIVYYDDEDEIWIVSFVRNWDAFDFPDGMTMTGGGSTSIAIQKSDGKVLRIWNGA